VIGLICNVINLILNVALVFGVGSLLEGLGFVGAPIATALTTLVQCFLLWLYIYYYKIHVLTWPGWSWECLQWKGTLEVCNLRYFVDSNLHCLVLEVGNTWCAYVCWRILGI